jgi:hypothetical protein
MPVNGVKIFTITCLSGGQIRDFWVVSQLHGNSSGGACPDPQAEQGSSLGFSGSQPVGAFGEIVVSAQELNVSGVDRGAAF